MLFPLLELSFVLVQSHLIYIYYESPTRTWFRTFWDYLTKNNKSQTTLPIKNSEHQDDIKKDNFQTEEQLPLVKKDEKVSNEKLTEHDSLLVMN